MQKTIRFLFAMALNLFIQSSVFAQSDYPEGLFAVRFSEDGRYLATGGSAGNQLFHDQTFAGGIKIWDIEEKKLVKSFGQLSELHQIFGDNYSRVTRKQKNIVNFKDIVFNGSFPQGKVVLLPSSLVQIDQADIRAPSFIGATYGMENTQSNPILFNHGKLGSKKCGYSTKGAYDFIGPMVASSNGRYAAVVVNTCGSDHGETATSDLQYHSSLYVVDLNDNRVINTFPNIDAGVYGLGVSNNGARVVFVGANHFQAIDVADGKSYPIAKYDNEIFTMPQQFSSLLLSEDGKQLISLRYSYDIENGLEHALPWKNEQVEQAKRVSVLKIARNQQFFVLVLPKKSTLAFGEQGAAYAKNAGDTVLIMDATSGKSMPLVMGNEKETSFSNCVADISPDDSTVAVACNQGRVRIFDAASAEVVWQQDDIGRNESRKTNNQFIQALLEPALYW